MTKEEIWKLADFFYEKFGFRFMAIENGTATAEVTLTDELRNQLGLVYGGELVHFADLCAGMAYASEPRNMLPRALGTTAQCTISFMRGTRNSQKLLACAKVRKSGARLNFVDVEITDENGVLVSAGNFIFLPCVIYTRHRQRTSLHPSRT